MRFGSAMMDSSKVQIVPTTSKSNADVITGAPLVLRDGIAFYTESEEPLNRKDASGKYIPMTPRDVTNYVKDKEIIASYEAYRQIRFMELWNKDTHERKLTVYPME
jgi:hypothetical protein